MAEAIFPQNPEEVLDRLQSDIQALLPNLDPTLDNSFQNALIRALAGRLFDIYQQTQNVVPNLWPTSDVSSVVQFWGALYGIARNPASQSSGFITAQGVVGSIIPDSTNLTTLNASQFITTSAAQITTQNLSATSVTRIGQTATFTGISDHNLASNSQVTISGANETEYNGTYTITVTSLNTFEYTITGTPSSPATGAIIASSDIASIPVQSVDFGAATNVEDGAALTFSTPIAGVNNSAYVQFGEIGGGTDLESIADYQDRILFRAANPVTPFNAANIIVTAREIPGVTRVFVYEIMPGVGDVTIYFTRDNDTNIIPTASEVSTVKQYIIDTILPANTDPDLSLFVLAPVPITVNFSFLEIVPDTTAMRLAIQTNLENFFREDTTVGITLKAIRYQAAIIKSIDSDTGQALQTFTLANPVGDIAILAGQLPILGNISFT